MISRIKEIKNLIQNYLDFSLSSRSFQTRNYSVNEKKKKRRKWSQYYYIESVVRKSHANLDYHECRWYQVNKFSLLSRHFFARESSFLSNIPHDTRSRKLIYPSRFFCSIIEQDLFIVGDFLRKQFTVEKENRNSEVCEQ